MDLPILSLLIVTPLLGAALIMLVKHRNPETERKNVRATALWVSLFVFALSLLLLWNFDTTQPAMQFVEKTPWVPAFNIFYHVGVDGLSLPLILLTTLLTPLCVLVSWESITTRVRPYYAAFLALEGVVIGVFCALDFVLFYVLWEAVLIPMFLIIGIWGGERRVYAALKFFLYTFVGSVLMLVAMMYLYFAAGKSFDIQAMANLALDPSVQWWLWLAFFAAFAVKVPMWPFHTWLPDAHVQAPTAGSVILAGVLLKLGAYGFMRFSLPILPDASLYFAPFVFTLSVIAIIYAALVAFAQTDIKKMIAYSSVSHMGFITLGIFAGTVESLQGSVLQMVNHGIVSAALFMLVGVVYDRLHTREINQFGGLVQPMPVYAAIMMVFTMAAVALPGTNSFVGEFMILLGSFPIAPVFTAIASIGVVLGAVYMLWLYRKMVFGTPVHAHVKELTDMNMREIVMFLPLLALVAWLGLAPVYALKLIEPTAAHLATEANLAHPKVQLVSDKNTPIQPESH